MRIRALRLDAYGPFSDVVLDLDAHGPALHLVHGSNEAGKSSALRALVALLYGIDEKTRDAHLHPYGKLRVGAVIERADGSVLRLARKKGRKNTLLGPGGDPIDEAVLRAALGGVGRDLFETVFGLTHAALHRGGEALLAGRGDVAESLFDAGVGGRGIHRVLADLEKEADELFAPRGSARPLNQAIAAFKEAKRLVAHASLSGSAWEAQEQAIEERRVLVRELDAQLGALMKEQITLTRHNHVIPKLDARRRLIAQRAELEEVPPLPADAREQRLAAQRTIEMADQAMARLSQDIERLEERRANLDIPAALEALTAEVVDELHGRLAAQRKADLDLPKREAEGRIAADDALAILRRLGRGASLDEVDQLRVPPDRIARIRALASRRSGREESVERERDELVDRQARLDRARERLARLGEPRDTTALCRALERARALGDVDGRLRDVRAEAARAGAAAEAATRALGPSAVSSAEMAARPLPPHETVTALVARLSGVEAARAKRRARSEDTEIRRDERTAQIERLEAAGSVPSEEELTRAREARDRLWGRIRGGESAAGDTGKAFEGSVRDSDDVADRLRREAERVSRHASLAADVRACERDLAKHRAALAELDEQEREIEGEWRHLMEPTGLAVPRVAEMRAWIARATEAQRLAAEAMELEARVRELEASIRTHAGDLSEALDHTDVPSTDSVDRTRLAPLVDRAAAVVAREAERAAEHRALAKAIADLGGDVDAIERRLAAREAALEDWKRDWAEAVAVIGLREDAAAEEATELLSALGELYQKADAARERQRRALAIRRDADRLARDAEVILAAHLPDASTGTMDQRIDQLVERHRRMRAHVDKRAEIDRDLDEKRAELEERVAERTEAEARIAKLVSNAGVDSPEALPAVEERVASARDLEQRIWDVEQNLLDVGGGASVDDLAEETGELELVDVRKRLAVISDDIDSVKEELRVANQELGGQQRGLEDLRKRSAENAAAEAQACLATIRNLAQRHARARFAAAFLRREIERYREKNQGPILSRASVLFPKLTLESFAALRVGVGEADRAVLRCVRPDGTEVDVDGLSTATRDQLFLALRLATLEHHAAHTEPLPFVLDDILVEFDDDRARAALAALGELAGTLQVILFTHHSHLLELARDAVPEGRLREHDLDALRRDRVGPKVGFADVRDRANG